MFLSCCSPPSTKFASIRPATFSCAVRDNADIWVGTAADLAERGVVGIFPVSGWWKEQPKRDRSKFGARYALVVAIETEADGVDIWTPVAQEIGVPVEEAIIEI